MTTRNRLIAQSLGQVISNNNLSADGEVLSTAATTVYGSDYTAVTDLSGISDSSGLVDGSMHYLSEIRKLFVWDDSDGSFYNVALDSDYLGYEPPTGFQGSSHGYLAGGNPSPAPNIGRNEIEKYSFSSDGNSSDVGNLATATGMAAGQSSSNDGYTSGGNPPTTNVIQNYPFSSDANASDVGDLTASRWGTGGSSSDTNGYTSGGEPTPYVAANALIIDKFPFSSDTNASDVGDLTQGRPRVGGLSSTDNGYVFGGQPSTKNVIDKFPFSTDANATDVGDLLQNGAEMQHPAGQNSYTTGYVSGGTNGPASGPNGTINVIQSFPFATDTNATDVGDLTVGRYGIAGTSSTASGYSAGGRTTPGSNFSNVIDKFPFSTDANATDVADITAGRSHMAPGQV